MIRNLWFRISRWFGRFSWEAEHRLALETSTKNLRKRSDFQAGMEICMEMLNRKQRRRLWRQLQKRGILERGTRINFNYFLWRNK